MWLFIGFYSQFLPTPVQFNFVNLKGYRGSVIRIPTYDLIETVDHLYFASTPSPFFSKFLAIERPLASKGKSGLCNKRSGAVGGGGGWRGYSKNVYTERLFTELKSLTLSNTFNKKMVPLSLLHT